jgi:signal transduction histidine kinase
MSASTAASREGEPKVSALLASPEPRAHMLELHDDDAHLVDRVAHYFAAGLRLGLPALAVATAAHRDALAQRIAAGGVDVGAAVAGGRLVMLDPEAVLDAIMDRGAPSPARFRDYFGGAIARARAGGAPTVRAYGELVDVLWQRGERAAALRLEALWNELAAEQPFELLCSYAMDNFGRTTDREGFEAVCRAHTHVIPTERIAPLATSPAQMRELSMLEQRARSLEHEIERRTRLEARLREALEREKAAREEAERAVRFNEMFVGMLGHDLRNPLGAIAMGATYIARSSPNEKITRTTTRILASTSRMSSMVEQLLDFSRIRLGRDLPLQAIRIDLAELCARVKDELEAAHPECSIALELDGSALGTWDYERLLRVFGNVVGNAVAHGAPGHGVSIRIDGRDPDLVATAVHNAGAIPPETLAVLFEPFRGTSRQHHTQGLGLGLFITRQIVHAHGGTIEAASTEASGTSIRIALPRAAPPAEAGRSAP